MLENIIIICNNIHISSNNQKVSQSRFEVANEFWKTDKLSV